MQPERPVVTVVGSYALGLTIRVDRMPVEGETVIGSRFDRGPGGKGSNQAIQAARVGADVALVAAIGDDDFGGEAMELWQREGISFDHVVRLPGEATGVGFILVEPKGENRIVLDPGANDRLSAGHVAAAASRIASSGAVIAQLEIPLATALAALAEGRRSGVLTILNPAPAQRIPLEALAGIDVVTPNQTELRILAGRGPNDAHEDELTDCSRLLKAGIGCVVLTRGEAGARIVRPGGVLDVPSISVKVVDTTGAGDAFSATLAVGLAAGEPIEQAVHRAVVAGALACTALGVVPALPTAAMLRAVGRDIPLAT